MSLIKLFATQTIWLFIISNCKGQSAISTLCFADSIAVQHYIQQHLKNYKTVVTTSGILVFNPTYDSTLSVSFKIKWKDFLNSKKGEVTMDQVIWIYNPSDGHEYLPVPSNAFINPFPCKTSIPFCLANHTK